MRKHAVCCAALAVAAVFCFSSISFSQKEDKPEPRPEPAAEAVKLAGANNRFGLELLAELRKDDQNIVVSPASIAMCLQLLATAADGATEEELRKTMHVEDADLPKANRALLDHWKERDGVKLEVANGVWANTRRIIPAEAFSEQASENFDAEITSMDFAADGALQTINDWISEHTNDMIKDMLEELLASDPCVIANAVYFKGDWKREFDKKKSEQGTFKTPTGPRNDVWMMHSGLRSWKYLADGETQVVRMPYKADDFASMWIILPPADEDMDEFARRADAATLDGWFQRASKRLVKVTLPRFKIRSKMQLNKPLQSLGMKQAFDTRADFHKLAADDSRAFYVQKVVHEAVVVVDEKGTEAAAATVVHGGCMGAPPKQPKAVEIVCDRPFIFVIRDDLSGAILFIGLVQNPEQ